MNIASKTVQDILEIPYVVELIRDNFNAIELLSSEIQSRCRCLYFIGCGSSYYIAMLSSHPLYAAKDFSVYAMPSSELVIYHLDRITKSCCVVGFSRSGETAETLEALEGARRLGAYTAMVSISRSERGMNAVDRYLYIDVGGERGIVMTKSFVALSIAGLIISISIASRWRRLDLVQNMLSAIYGYFKDVIDRRESYIDVGREIALKNIKRFIILGSGPSYPIALEASLKIKETSYVATEALHSLEFRHGPIATIGEEQSIILLNQSGRSYPYVYRLYRELREKAKGYSKTTIFIRFSSSDVDENTIEIPKLDVEEFEALTSILPLQLIAVGYANALELDVDRPRNLVRFVNTF